MNHSEQINELAQALSIAQSQFGTLKKSKKNTFNRMYSNFDDIMDTVRKPLSDNGLAFSQMLDNLDGAPSLISMLLHSSGQWIRATVPIVTVTGNKATNEVQEFGIAITYTKRYAITAMLGVGGEEDTDGNGAGEQGTSTQTTTQQADGDKFLIVSSVGATTTSTDKKCLGLWEAGQQYPSFYWWAGRDEFLKTCPWIGDTITKEQLGDGELYPFSAKVFYTEVEKSGKTYKNIAMIERIV